MPTWNKIKDHLTELVNEEIGNLETSNKVIEILDAHKALNKFYTFISTSEKFEIEDEGGVLPSAIAVRSPLFTGEAFLKIKSEGYFYESEYGRVVIWDKDPDKLRRKILRKGWI